MHYVVDCSFSSALFLPDEKSEIVQKFFLNLKKNEIVFVPLLWWYETNNVLNVSVKRKRLNHHNVVSIINLLNDLRLATDTEHGTELSKKIFELTQLYNISSYDAAYLELAIRNKAKLLSLDEELISAAKTIGIETI